MAGLIAKPLKLRLVHPDDSSTDTDSDDDLSLCDLPIRAPSVPSFSASSPPAAKVGTVSSGANGNRVLPVSVDEEATGAVDVEDNDNPFEFFFGARHGPGMCSPSAVFSGGRMFPARQAPTSTSSDSTVSPLLARAANANSTSSWSSPSDSSHAYSGLPPPPMSRRSRSEAVRRPPRDTVAYNRSASVEGRSKGRHAGLGGGGRKGDYRRLPPLQAAPPATSSPFGSSASNKKASGGTTCSIDAVPSCGPRPKWYVFATFATVKPPQAEMDMKGIRTRQKKRTTQQSADGGTAGGLPTISRLASEARRVRKSWFLNSLSCRVDVDALAWSPSDPPHPIALTYPIQGPLARDTTYERTASS